MKSVLNDVKGLIKLAKKAYADISKGKVDEAIKFLRLMQRLDEKELSEVNVDSANKELLSECRAILGLIGSALRDLERFKQGFEHPTMLHKAEDILLRIIRLEKQEFSKERQIGHFENTLIDFGLNSYPKLFAILMQNEGQVKSILKLKHGVLILKFVLPLFKHLIRQGSDLANISYSFNEIAKSADYSKNAEHNLRFRVPDIARYFFSSDEIKVIVDSWPRAFRKQNLVDVFVYGSLISRRAGINMLELVRLLSLVRKEEGTGFLVFGRSLGIWRFHYMMGYILYPLSEKGFIKSLEKLQFYSRNYALILDKLNNSEGLAFCEKTAQKIISGKFKPKDLNAIVHLDRKQLLSGAA